MTNHEFELFKQIVSMGQPSLKKAMARSLKRFYPDVIETKDYIVAPGDIPIGLVAHLDTVFNFPAQDVYFDREKQVIWSPDGLGADDRAGVLGILNIIRDKAKYRPWIFLTTNEEKGGLGACALAEEVVAPPLKFLIELDRRGKNDCVFYDCNTADFKKYIESFGFKEAKGSFSDISFLMSEWNMCGVNLSIGYEDEHTYTETFFVQHWDETVQKVKTILSQESYPDFVFEETESYYTRCSKCGKANYTFETIPVGKEIYCIDCAVKYVEWCKQCGQPYLIGTKCKCEGV